MPTASFADSINNRRRSIPSSPHIRSSANDRVCGIICGTGVGGRSLRGVDGAGPAVVDVFGDVGGREEGAAAAADVVDEQAAVGGGGQYPVAVAVFDVSLADSDAPVVPFGAHDVAGLPNVGATREFGPVGFTG